jgi:hypothetical protein
VLAVQEVLHCLKKFECSFWSQAVKVVDEENHSANVSLVGLSLLVGGVHAVINEFRDVVLQRFSRQRFRAVSGGRCKEFGEEFG